jgi:uncharacterized protein (DUF4415 family)
MNEKALKKKSDTDWEHLSKMDDDDIDYSDISPLDKSFFKNAMLRLPEPKQAVNIRIDKDVLEWYKKQGTGYQTRMNAVLRMYMQTKNETVHKRVIKKTQKTKANKLK